MRVAIAINRLVSRIFFEFDPVVLGTPAAHTQPGKWMPGNDIDSLAP